MTPLRKRGRPARVGPGVAIRKLLLSASAVSILGACDAQPPSDGVGETPDSQAARSSLTRADLPGWQPERDPQVPGPTTRVGDAGRYRRSEPEESRELQALIERLEALGYAAGSQPPSDAMGVVRHEESAQPGLNFYTSGHAPEALLVDMDGRVLHRWQRSFLETFPERERIPLNGHFWRRAVPLENGDLLAIFTGLGIARLDRDSNLIWARPLPVHHDLQMSPGGDIAVLARKAHVVPRVAEEFPILEDFVLVLGPDGAPLRRISLLEAFENAEPEFSWREASRRFWEREKTRRRAAASQRSAFDIFHTNSIEILDGRYAARNPAFRAGNALISFCHLDAIAVVDLERTEVVWAEGDAFSLQHDPSLLPSGDVMVFDNLWRTDRSRVAIVDPASAEVTWQYAGSEREPFFSRTCGNAQRLDNGNVLITESDQGRAFEVTRDKRIVWEFLSPHRAGEQDEFVATLFELRRLPLDYGRDWLQGPAGGRGVADR